MPEWQRGQLWTVDPHIVHRHRCLHGNNNTIDSLTPHSLHILLLPTRPSFCFMFPQTSFSSTSSVPRLLLPQLDSAGATPPWLRFSSLTWASTSSRLFLSEFAVASLFCANSLQIWFSTLRLFTLSWSTQLSFPRRWISSSFSLSFFATASCMAFTNILDCLTRCSSSSIHTLCVYKTEKKIISQEFWFGLFEEIRKREKGEGSYVLSNETVDLRLLVLEMEDEVLVERREFDFVGGGRSNVGFGYWISGAFPREGDVVGEAAIGFVDGVGVAEGGVVKRKHRWRKRQTTFDLRVVEGAIRFRHFSDWKRKQRAWVRYVKMKKQKQKQKKKKRMVWCVTWRLVTARGRDSCAEPQLPWFGEFVVSCCYCSLGSFSYSSVKFLCGCNVNEWINERMNGAMRKEGENN